MLADTERLHLLAFQDVFAARGWRLLKAEYFARLGRRHRLAIASGAFRGDIEAILDPAGLRSAFEAIVGADDVAAGKPAPDPYLEAVRRLGVGANGAVAIEDSPWALESARAAGLCTIAITTSYAAPSIAAAADCVIGSLDELTDELIARVFDARAV